MELEASPVPTHLPENFLVVNKEIEQRSTDGDSIKVGGTTLNKGLLWSWMKYDRESVYVACPHTERDLIFTETESY